MPIFLLGIINIQYPSEAHEMLFSNVMLHSMTISRGGLILLDSVLQQIILNEVDTDNI